jgi:hypothetical protein
LACRRHNARGVSQQRIHIAAAVAMNKAVLQHEVSSAGFNARGAPNKPT